MTRILQGILPIFLACASLCLANLEAVYEWKYIDYLWESDDQKAAAIEDGIYDHEKVIMFDMQPLLDGRVVVTTPKYDNNPATVSTISDQTGDGGPLLAPYPDWSWHNQSDCSGITSVNRVVLDDCNRLWLVDSGKIDNEQVCPAKILVFNPDTDELIKEVEIPTNLTHNQYNETKGRLVLYAVETTGELCKNTWAYMADVEGYGLVISDGSDIWRLNDEIFIPTDETDTFLVGDTTVTMDRRPVVVLVFPSGYFEPNILLFRNQLGPNNFVASLDEIHESKSGAKVNWYSSNLVMTTPEPAKVITRKGGVLFSNFPPSTQYACWNLATTLLLNNTAVLEKNSTTLQYTSSAKTTVNADGESETVWVGVNNAHEYIMGTMDFENINFRIMTADVDSYIEGTLCVPNDDAVATSIEDHNFSLVETG